jgi:hypothetical protein
LGSRRLGVLIALVLCCACSPPKVTRPLEGAPPIVESGAQAGGSTDPGLPPTLSPPGASPGASPEPGSAGAAVASPSPSPSPRAEGGYFIAATGGRGVNLRDGPSTSARVLTTLAEGSAIEVIGDPVPGAGGPWRNVRGGGREGWIVEGVVRKR